MTSRVSVAIEEVPAKERQRRMIVRLVHVIFVLVLLEGVLRKWVLPQIEQPLLFIRDPFMLAVIVYYLGYRGARFSIMAFWYMLTAFGLFFVGLLQVTSGIGAAVAILIGLRFYLLFVPLLFIIPETFKPRDIASLFRLCLLVSIPVGILTVMQFYSPVESAINKGLSDDLKDRFTVVAGVVRPYGPFTFTLAQATFSAFALSVALITFMQRKLVPVSTIFLAVSGMAVLSMGAVSGGRSFFVPAALIVVFTLVGSLAAAARTGRFSGTVALMAAVAAFLLIFIVVFPDAYTTMSERQANADMSEGSIFNRMWVIFTAVTDQFDKVSVLGAGIGVGSNAGTFLTIGGRGFLLAEYEWPRMVLEVGPFFGLLFIMVRVLLSAVMLFKAFQAARRGSSAAMTMAGFAVPLIFIAQITGNNGMATLPWIAAGVCLALARPDEEAAAASPAPEPDAVAQRRIAQAGWRRRET